MPTRCGPYMNISFYPTTSGPISGTSGETNCRWNTDIPRNSDEISLNQAQSIFGDLHVQVTDRLRVSGLYEYNFLDKTRVQTGVGLNYTADCWSFEGRVVDKVNVENKTDLNWEFKIKLFGLGEFGI